MEVTPQSMRDTLRLWASGVSIVTTRSGETVAGMTVSAFNSLSLDPPQIVICVNKDAYPAQLIQDSGVFAVSFLEAGSAGLSDRFAGRLTLDDGEDRFDGIETFTAATGSPILGAALAWLDCRVRSLHDGGTHWIIVGAVLATDHRPDTTVSPLIYFDRSYHELHQVKVEV